MLQILQALQKNYRTCFATAFLVLVFYFSKLQSYLLFHTFVELFSIVVAFAVFIVTWNSRRMQDNVFLQLVGISYLFIGALDLLHTLTFKGMTMIPVPGFPANQFWIATRMLEALTFVTGLWCLRKQKRFSPELVFIIYFVVGLLIMFSILVWQIFPVSFVEGTGQTPFKIYAEYTVVFLLSIAVFSLKKLKQHFSPAIYQLLFVSLFFTIISEFCFTLYISNYSTANEIGHYAKLISFILIYKANVETAFIRPTDLIFNNLKESEEKYRTLANNLPGLVLLYNSELQRIYANHNRAQGFQDLDQRLNLLLNRAQLTGMLQSDSFQTEGFSGNTFYALQVIPEQTSEGTEAGYLAICQDVTELKKTEQQLQALIATKDKLFSIIAHDLKNPFTTLLSYSELISKKSNTLDRVKIGHIAARMNESARHAYGLLDNLLHWSRLQTGILKPVLEQLDVSAIFSEAQQLAAPLAQSKGIVLEFETLPALSVVADKRMIATVFRNLLSNAVKFSYQDNKVSINARAQENVVLFSVSDQGTGIATAHQQKLFEVGNQFSAPGTAAEQGTGLGLVLCREFVENNAGQIWLESQLGIGTTFYFTLPAGQRRL